MISPFIKEKIEDLVRKGAVFWIKHSGGKDSQVMFLTLKELIPRELLKVVHAHLPEVEWPDVISHIKNIIEDRELIVVQAVKTFFDMVKRRRKFPSPSTRQCTSDLTTGLIEKAIRHYIYKTGHQLKDIPDYFGQTFRSISDAHSALSRTPTNRQEYFLLSPI